MRYLADDTEAPEILDAVVDAASRAMVNRKVIKFFDAYLLKGWLGSPSAAAGEINASSTWDWADLELLAGPVSMDLDRQLDNAKCLKVLRACMDPDGGRCTVFAL
jgi:hypothetical protein